ncbi:MAG: ATP-binding protein [Desulfobacteraceae bacterium]|jgi:two-component system phosphate regulon sensor histidine kinase PhoR
MKKRKPLIWHLYPPYLILVLAALLAIGWYASRSMRHFYLSQIHQNLFNQSQLLKHQFLPLLEASRYPELDRYCKEGGKQSSTRLTVILPDGTVVGDSEAMPAKMENHGDRQEIRQALDGTEGSATRFSGTLRQHMMYVAVPISDDETIRGVVRVSIAIDEVENQMRSLRVRMAVGGIIIALLVSIVCLLISRRISNPIKNMRQGAERYAQGDLSHRLQSPDTIELAALAEAMNQMAHELERRIQTVISQRNESQAVLSSMVEGVIALNSQEQIMDINAAATRLLKRSGEELKGRSIQEIMRNRDLHRMVQITLVDGTNNEGDVTLYQNGRQILYIHCTPLVDAGGHRMGILLVMNDVTQLRRLENMRSDFAANVSHEIKTPLTAIQGFVETLAHGSVENPEEARRFLGIIQKHVSRLTTIIDDLMQLSRMEQDRETYRPKYSKTAAVEVIRSAVQLCSNTAKKRQITIVIEADGKLTVSMDADLIEQALVNLLDNAIKYSPTKSKITIGAHKADQTVKIWVTDRGIGIPKKHHPRLFERFYRVDKARSRNMGGTGLGLAIVKHIIQSHRGRVTVQSVQGRGSTFTLHLPDSATTGAGGGHDFRP